MKYYSIRFLQAIIILIGLGALGLLLLEPQMEGRNPNATLFEIYFQDPFLAFAYLGSIPFFVSMYQIFKILGYEVRNRVFSSETLSALRIIRYSAIALIGFVVLGAICIMMNESDDRAGGYFMLFLIFFGSTIMAAAATVWERIIKAGMELKLENEQLKRH